MEIKKIFYLLMALITLLSCESVDSRLQVINRSKKTIFFHLSKDTILNMNSQFVNPNGDIIRTVDLVDVIPPDSSQKVSIIGVGNAWKRYVESNFPDSTLNLFIIDLNTLKQLPKENIITSNEALYRFELHVKDLEKLNWQIVYEAK